MNKDFYEERYFDLSHEIFNELVRYGKVNEFRKTILRNIYSATEKQYQNALEYAETRFNEYKQL